MFVSGRFSRWARPTLHMIVLICLCTGNGFADSNSPDINFFKQLRMNMNDIPQQLFSDVEYTFSNQNNLFTLAIAGGIGAVLHNSDADRNIHENLERHRTFADFPDKAIETIGSPYLHAGVAGLWYLGSLYTADDENREKALTLLSALAITDAVVLGLKYTVDTERPNGDNHAFPSGHTASAFAAASVLDEFYGPTAGTLAYLTAGLVGWQRLDAGEHWASDVVFGAVLGWVVGHSVGENRTFEVAGFDVVPMIEPSLGSGIALVRRF